MVNVWNNGVYGCDLNDLLDLNITKPTELTDDMDVV